MKNLIVNHQSTDLEKEQALAAIKGLFLDFEPGATDETVYNRVFGPKENELEILLKDDSVVGFGIYRLFYFNGDLVLYRIGDMIHPNFQGQSLYRTLIQSAIERHRPDYMALYTQVPRVYGTLLSMFGRNLYPSLDFRTPKKIMEVAKSISKRPIDMDQAYPIISNFYDIDRTGRTDRVHKNQRVNDFFEKHLGKFDSFALVVRLP